MEALGASQCLCSQPAHLSPLFALVGQGTTNGEMEDKGPEMSGAERAELDAVLAALLLLG